jgi:hypothetical protein
MIRIRIEAPTASSFVLNPTRKGDRQNHIRRSEQGKMRRKKEETLKKEGTSYIPPVKRKVKNK